MSKLLSAVGALAMVVAATGSQAAGDAAAGQTKAATCSGCHGTRGEGVAPNPRIAGMAEDRFVAAMKAYQDGSRPHPVMKTFVTGLSEQDLADLAAFYARQ